MKNKATKSPKKAAKKFLYACSVYIRDAECLELLREAAAKSGLGLSAFLLSSSLQEALRVRSSRQG